MTISDSILRAVLLRALADQLGTQTTAARAELAAVLGAAGATSARGELPDGTHVATLTQARAGRECVVTDERALREWVRAHAPDEITSRVVIEIRPAYLTKLRKELAAAGAAEVPDPETGELLAVPGVEVRRKPAPAPSLRLMDGAGDAIVDAWRRGDLAHLDLPQLSGGEAS